MQAAAVKVLGGLLVQAQGLFVGFGDADELQEARPVGVAVLAELVHLLPESPHGAQAELVAEVGEVAVHVVEFRAPAPGLDGAAAGNPNRGVGFLHRPRPDVHVALLVEAAVEGEGFLRRPSLHDEVVGFVVALAQLGRVLSVGVGGVHGRADWEAGDQAAAGDAVEHGELLGHPDGRVVERQRVAHHAERRILGAAGQGGGDQVGRWHQPVAIGVMLVAANAVEAHLGGILQLVHELVVHDVCPAGIEQAGIDINPHRFVLVAEVVRQFLVGHQVEPQIFQATFSLRPLGAGEPNIVAGLVIRWRRLTNPCGPDRSLPCSP